MKNYIESLLLGTSLIILTAAVGDKEPIAQGTITCLENRGRYFEKARLTETIFAGGVTDRDDIKEHQIWKCTYLFGKNYKRKFGSKIYILSQTS